MKRKLYWQNRAYADVHVGDVIVSQVHAWVITKCDESEVEEGIVDVEVYRVTGTRGGVPDSSNDDPALTTKYSVSGEERTKVAVTSIFAASEGDFHNLPVLESRVDYIDNVLSEDLLSD